MADFSDLNNPSPSGVRDEETTRETLLRVGLESSARHEAATRREALDKIVAIARATDQVRFAFHDLDSVLDSLAKHARDVEQDSFHACHTERMVEAARNAIRAVARRATEALGPE